MPLDDLHVARDRLPLSISYDRTSDVLMIDGVRYAGDLFRTMGIGPTGRPIIVTRKEDGVVTLFTFELTESGIAAAQEELARLYQRS